MLKAEIKRRNMTYEQLAEKLAEIGVQDSARNIINKINRGVVLGGVLRAVPPGDRMRNAPAGRRTQSDRRWILESATSLANALTDAGITETEGSIAVKINRGAFPAWFLIAAMEAIGASSLRLSE